MKRETFLNSEMILTLIQTTHVQITVYNEFLKLCDGDPEEAKIQTQIYMNALMNPQTKKE